MIKIVFFGTPEYVIPILSAINKEFKDSKGKSPIVAVVTQQPKPKGRKQILSYSAVDNWAHQRKIPIYFDAYDLIKNDIKADLGILASYGAIIPANVINHFAHGILNIHPSLLPKWRGASPVQATILAGEKETGVTIIKLDEILDHGEIISQFREDVKDNDTTETLRNRLFERSAQVLVTLIPAFLQGKITPRKQEESSATFTKQITKQDGFISPNYLNIALEGKTQKKEWRITFMKDFFLVPSAVNIERFIRAMQPWPVAWTRVKIGSGEKRLKISKAHLEENKLVPDEVQLEGKNPVSWKQFSEAYSPKLN